MRKLIKFKVGDLIRWHEDPSGYDCGIVLEFDQREMTIYWCSNPGHENTIKYYYDEYEQDDFIKIS